MSTGTRIFLDFITSLCYNEVNGKSEFGGKEMTLNRIDHFVITTKNLCQCLHFYVDILGMEHKIQREENDQHTLHFGNQKINIHTYVCLLYTSDAADE